MKLNKVLKNQTIMFILMVLVGMAFNPMNVLAYRLDDLYVSYTLFYGGLLMASNMIWAHEIYHLLAFRHFNVYVFGIGICMSLLVTYGLLRNQFMVNDTQWLKRMISHHSTALTTSQNIYEKTNDPRIKKLAFDIIETQEREISLMKSFI